MIRPPLQEPPIPAGWESGEVVSTAQPFHLLTTEGSHLCFLSVTSAGVLVEPASVVAFPTHYVDRDLTNLCRACVGRFSF